MPEKIRIVVYFSSFDFFCIDFEWISVCDALDVALKHVVCEELHFSFAIFGIRKFDLSNVFDAVVHALLAVTQLGLVCLNFEVIMNLHIENALLFS